MQTLSDRKFPNCTHETGPKSRFLQGDFPHGSVSRPGTQERPKGEPPDETVHWRCRAAACLAAGTSGRKVSSVTIAEPVNSISVGTMPETPSISTYTP